MIEILLGAAEPYLAQIGPLMEKQDATYGSTNIAYLITKTRDVNGNPKVFLSFIEKPKFQDIQYIKYPEGEPVDADGNEMVGKAIIMDFSKLFSLLTSANKD